MTGAYLRAFRNGKWTNVEVEHLTDEELHAKFINRPSDDLIGWMSMLCAKLRQIEPVFESLVRDGILVKEEQSEARTTATAENVQPELPE